MDEPLPPTVTAVLRPGDVLLSLGVGKTSLAIKTFDGGRYSHAALWTGEGVIESTTPRVREGLLADSLREHPRQVVDAYRHRSLSADEALAVVARAREYVGRAYSYGDLFLCASLMAIAANFPPKGQVSFLRDACEFLHFMALDRPADGELVTCTQLVVRAFARAGVSIRVQPRAAERVDVAALVGAARDLAVDAKRGAADRSFLSKAERDEWLAMQADLRRKCEELTGPSPTDDDVKGPLARWDGRAAVRAQGEWRANLVMPRYLETSPDLELVATIYPAAGPGAPPGTPARSSPAA